MGFWQKVSAALVGKANVCTRCGKAIWASTVIYLSDDMKRLCKDCYQKDRLLRTDQSAEKAGNEQKE